MKHLTIATCLAGALAVGGFLAADEPSPAPKEPAKLAVSVSPAAIAPGGKAEVTLRLEPIAGVKINRYPKIKLEVPARPGLVGQAAVEVGNAAPPAPDAMDRNYYKTVDPVVLTLQLDSAAPKGTHQIEGKLTYFYCVAASGFCAPAHVPVTIPVAVR